VPASNRLQYETSPYLLQHAGNPVDWWPWSDEAFAEARRREVPVVISVGYSACHWCHVMAHESFEDARVAEVLNGAFVAVKVDREERPDIDAVYMEALQLVSGGGGWPMTVVALPDGRPFWAGTYLPKANFLVLLNRVKSLWSSDRAGIEADAARLAAAVRQGAALPARVAVAGGGRPGDPGEPEKQGEPTQGRLVLARAAEGLLARLDPEWGGFGEAPKFPQPATLELLAEYWWRSHDERALAALTGTLDAMSSGGIYDHLAGGFARYSTDRYWLVPHFEKMLYDNALLVRAYTHGWQLTGSPRYKQVVEETVGYLLAPPMRLPGGAWASAEDADSEGEEGRFYTWSLAEVEQVAGPAAAEWYGASAEGNWEGKNILWRPGVADIARPPDVEQARQLLLERRRGRPRPSLDAKVLTEWNAMAVAALAYAGTAFGQPAWVSAAAQTAEVLIEHLSRPDGRWLRSWRPDADPGASDARYPGHATDGSEAAGLSNASDSGDGGDGDGRDGRWHKAASGGAGRSYLAYAADYAWLVEAFTRLGEATGQSRWTGAAQEAASALVDLFWDKENGGFFTYGDDAEVLIARMKDLYDGAVPSANATAALALARLGELTGDAGLTDVATQTVDVMAPALARAPSAFPGLALAASYISAPRRQVVISSKAPALLRPVWERFLPDTVLAWGEPYASPLWEGRAGPGTMGQAFVCEGYACQLPVADAGALGALLDGRPL
jgi:uncharacterized protein